MQIHVAVLLGDVSGKICHFHLLLELHVHIFLGGRVQKTQNNIVHGSETVNLSRQDVLFPAEFGQCRSNFTMIVNAEKISVFSFRVLVHSIIIIGISVWLSLRLLRQ